MISRLAQNLIQAVLVATLASIGTFWSIDAGAQMAQSTPQLTWNSQSYPGGQVLYSVSCPSTTTCTAVGKSGTIVGTINAGGTWVKETSSTTSTLYGISCVSTSECVAVGAGGTVVFTTNAGNSWQAGQSTLTTNLDSVSCPSSGQCWAVGASGVIVASGANNDSGPWTVQQVGGANLYGISCIDVTDCTAVGFAGAIFATSNGSTWMPEVSGVTTTLNTISCVTATQCWAAGGSQVITTPNGSTWQATGGLPNASSLEGIDCTDFRNCWVTGVNPGTVDSSSDGGASWIQEMPDSGNWLNSVSCANATHCWAVGNGVIMSGFSPPSEVNPTSPVYNADAPDPDVVSYQGTYYAFTTGTKEAPIIQILSSGNLASWNLNGSALKKIPSWEKVGTQESPGVFFWDNKWIMYYAAIESSTNTRCISMATSTQILGPYVDSTLGPLECDPTIGGALDPQPFIDPSGTAYLYWKSNDGLSGVNAQIWVAPINNTGLPEVASATSLITQDQPGTTEAPFMQSYSGTYYLFYSIGSWDSSNYGVGYATCSTPSGPCTTTQVNSVMSSNSYVLGPGSASVVTDNSGQLWLAYCGWNGPTSKFSYAQGDYRSLWMAQMSFPGGVPTLDLQPPQVAPAPNVTGLSSSVGSASGGASVTIYGSNLSGAIGVSFANAPAESFTVVSPSQISVVTPPGSPGTVDVTVTTPNGASAISCQDQYTFTESGTAELGGYWLVSSLGSVYGCGANLALGSAPPGTQGVVSISPTSDVQGYWLANSQGSIYTFGDASFYGSMGGKPLNQPIVAMASTADSKGYWMVASDGGIFSFGDASFYGSMGAVPTNGPISAMG